MPLEFPSGQIERKKQRSCLLRASRRASRFVVVMTGCPFRHCASRSVSKGTTYHNHNEPACSSRSTEQLGTLFFSFDLPTGQFSGGWLGSGHPPPSEAGAGGEKTEDRRRKSGDRGAGDRRRRKGECSLWRKSNWTNRQPGKYGHILRAPGLFLIGFAAKRNPLQGHSRCLMQ